MRTPTLTSLLSPATVTWFVSQPTNPDVQTTTKSHPTPSCPSAIPSPLNTSGQASFFLTNGPAVLRSVVFPERAVQVLDGGARTRIGPVTVTVTVTRPGGSGGGEINQGGNGGAIARGGQGRGEVVRVVPRGARQEAAGLEGVGGRGGGAPRGERRHGAPPEGLVAREVGVLDGDLEREM